MPLCDRCRKGKRSGSISPSAWRRRGQFSFSMSRSTDLLNLLAGYTLRFLLTASIAVAAAALMSGAANSAIVVLAFTIEISPS